MKASDSSLIQIIAFRSQYPVHFFLIINLQTIYFSFINLFACCLIKIYFFFITQMFCYHLESFQGFDC